MKKNNSYGQRGAVLMLTALLLPLIIAVTGMTIDFGNVYLHKSVLQNCADSSALGGARHTLDKNNNKFVKEDADWEADKLLTNNQKYPLASKSYQYLGSKSDSQNTHYYVVILKENVPMFFLRYFGLKEMEIEASCIAKIPGGRGSFPLFDNLITYSKELYIVNSNQKSFKGNIYKTKSDAKGTVQGYIVNGSELGLIKNNGKEMDINNTQNYHPEFAVGLEEPQNKELKAYIDDLRKNTEKTPTTTQKLTADDLKNPVTYIYDDDPNKRMVSEITIDKDFDTNPNKTHVLIVTAGAVNLKFNSNVTCKLIIINLSDQNFAINSTGTIHATIYAPNVSQIVWNANNSDFYGSITAPKVELQGGAGNFIHESPNLSGDSGGNSNRITIANGDDVAW